MIQLTFPGITQEQFSEAFRVLESCVQEPSHGFPYPYMGPGGGYGACWWERDSALTLNGLCWKDPAFCEKALLNFTAVQKENGRIPLWGNDQVPGFDTELSAVPVLFESALRICRRTADKGYIREIYRMLARYMDWWLSPIKRDPATGLVCGIFEETDPSDYTAQLTYAPVDLNVQIAVGADCLRVLAAHLGERTAAAEYASLFADLRERINRLLWDAETEQYYTRNVREMRLLTERPYSSTFDPFKRRIVPAPRTPALLALLKAPGKYGYHDRFGLASAPYDSPEFCETQGSYKGWKSWCGNVWTFRNAIIARGLHESGFLPEAAHLAYQTVTTFNGKYAEFVNPSTGEGHGVQKYGWTAAQYLELLLEELFGIDYCAWTDTVTVAPKIPPELYGERIAVSGLCLGGGKKLSVTVDCAPRPAVKWEFC